jgi:hypothetical protein
MYLQTQALIGARKLKGAWQNKLLGNAALPG